jgi:ApaG protein
MARYQFSVQVQPRYLEEQSEPDARRYLFAYTVTIRNTGEVTPVGSMHGSYQCIAEDGTAFEAPIPEFVLSVPRTLH